MEKEATFYNKYTKDMLSNFVPALVLVEAITHKLKPIEDITWFYVWKSMQPGFRALFSSC